MVTKQQYENIFCKWPHNSSSSDRSSRSYVMRIPKDVCDIVYSFISRPSDLDRIANSLNFLVGAHRCRFKYSSLLTSTTIAFDFMSYTDCYGRDMNGLFRVSVGFDQPYLKRGANFSDYRNITKIVIQTNHWLGTRTFNYYQPRSMRGAFQYLNRRQMVYWVASDIYDTFLTTTARVTGGVLTIKCKQKEIRLPNMKTVIKTLMEHRF